MKPTIRFNSLALSISTLLVFSFWLILNEIKGLNPYFFLISGFFMSYGIYKTTTVFLSSLLRNLVFFKKFVLGPSYLEGTWVGFYIGASGHLRYLIEIFEQDFEDLIIRGKSYDDQCNYHSTWNSETASIDLKKGKLTYLYEVSSIREITNSMGIAVFNFERKNQYKPPFKLVGISSDIHIGKRIKAMEIRVASKGKTDEELIKMAKELYASNKKVF